VENLEQIDEAGIGKHLPFTGLGKNVKESVTSKITKLMIPRSFRLEAMGQNRRQVTCHS
jgi:hypothetical protein